MKINKRGILVFFILLVLIINAGCLQKAVEKIKTPQTDLSVQVIGITGNNLELSMKAKINNLNPISLDVGNLNVTMRDENGAVFQKNTIVGGVIPGNGEKVFSSNINIPIGIITQRKILIELETRVGVAGINVKLPVRANISIVLPKLQNIIKAPYIYTFVKIEGITNKGLKVGVEATFKNPNSLGIVVSNIKLVMQSEEGNRYMKTTISGGTIKANNKYTFSKTLFLPISALNENILLLKLSTKVGAKGIDFKLPVTPVFRVQVPKLNSMINVPEPNVGVSVIAIKREAKINMTIKNENPISFTIGNIYVRIFNDNKEVGKGEINGGIIKSNSNNAFIGDIKLNRIVHNKVTTIITTNVGLEEIKEKLPIKATVTVTVKSGLSSIVSGTTSSSSGSGTTSSSSGSGTTSSSSGSKTISPPIITIPSKIIKLP